MTVDRRLGTRVDKAFRREEATGTRVDPYPYIGIVKNNLDPSRSGRLQVWIPDLGGDPDNKSNWRTVRYASPFQGYSNLDNTSNTNDFKSVTHTYGMWMVPPDIGVQVICIFIAGDPQRGYWIACVNPYLSHHMTPGLAGSTNVDITTASAEAKKGFVAGNNMPVAEFNETDKKLTNPSFFNNLKPLHEIQYNIYRLQGLDRDEIRGAISSSSQRESPSNVFGISTPGRPVNDPADDIDRFNQLANAGKITADTYKVGARKGGHTFVLDDGTTLGQDQLVRLRTARGHQLLMHDTANSVYLAHADGTSWVELTTEGSVKIYSQSGVSIRSQGTINLHSDDDININARNNINIRAGNKFVVNSGITDLLQGQLNVESTGEIGLKSGSDFKIDAGAAVGIQAGGVVALTGSSIKQNSGGTKSIKSLTALPSTSFPDTKSDENTGLWVSEPEKTDSIVTALPTHEPHSRAAVATFQVKQNTAQASVGIQPQATYTGTVDAIKNTTGTGVKNPASDTDLRNQPACDCTVGNLNTDQMKAYFAQLGRNESAGDVPKKFPDQYHVINTIGYVGKYQFGYQALRDLKMVKSSVTSNAQLRNPNSWIGNGGPASLEEFLNNGPLQEKLICQYTRSNYNSMLQKGAITADMKPEEVGGMLAVSHLLGAGGANAWRKGQGEPDKYGTTGNDYFGAGKYAIAVLAPKVPVINRS